MGLQRKGRSLLIDGVVGQIEIRVNGGKSGVERGEQRDQAFINKLVVLNHPHPLFGGTMDNKVVTTMERAFLSLGYVTVAFNFRGVGDSAGQYDEGVGEQADLLAVLEWSKAHFSPQKTVLAGFSFGSFVLLKALQQIEVDAVCTVAPPVGLYDFSAIHPVTVPWVLVQGGKDEVVCAEEILQWAMSEKSRPDVYWRANASHFLHGELVWLKNIILMNY